MTIRPFTCVAVLFALTAATVAWVGRPDPSALAAPPAPEAPLTAHIFEQRIYTTNPGLLPNLHERFRNHTNYLFVKHGMKLIAYWTPVDQEDTLIYVLAYPDMAARKASWDGFRNDPEWKRVWARLEGEGRRTHREEGRLHVHAPDRLLPDSLTGSLLSAP